MTLFLLSTFLWQVQILMGIKEKTSRREDGDKLKVYLNEITNSLS